MSLRITSPWIASAPTPGYAPLDGDSSVDVCVLGAGIAGLTTALLLAEAGRTVAVVEMDEVGAGVTGYTTAKVSALQGAVYQELRSKHDADSARIYAEAQVAGLDLVARWVEERGIDCDFRRKPAYTYAAEPKDVSKIEQEVEAAQEAGLDAEFTLETDLPYEVHAAVRLDGQAEFHPRKYLLALAAALPAPSRIYERTRALGVEEGSPCRVKTDRGTIEATDVVVATHYPMLDRGLFFARLSPERSYCVGVRVKGRAPQGMYISTGSTSRSIRSHPLDGELVIVGGEGHKAGQHGSATERYETLEAFAREHWDVVSVDYRWASQDAQPADGIPYVGHVTPKSKHLWTASGFRKWGLTNGTAAAMIIRDGILGEDNPWAGRFNSNRLTPKASTPTLLKENVNVGFHFFADRFAPPDAGSLEELAPGQGGIVRVDGDRVAAFRDDDGTVTAVSPVCTHLGCHVKFNDAERTWDCPCHGSRFATDGTVIEGPAVRDLERREVGQPPSGE